MDDDKTVEETFCFVDIAGYTALTDAHGESAAADLVDEFNTLLGTHVEPFGRIHEFIGDCAFLVFPNPVAAYSALDVLYRSAAAKVDFPIVRSGLHHGPALLRGNRYFGSTVNLAARAAAAALGGQILCTNAVADALRQSDLLDLRIEDKGLVTLKNIPEPVQLHALDLCCLPHQSEIDPVCKMQVEKVQAAGTLRHEEKTYWFCSLSCAERFARHPNSYV